MKLKTILILAFLYSASFAMAQPILHTNNEWENCSMILDPSLTQESWHQFAEEMGMIAYFTPMGDIKPLGKMNFRISMLMSSGLSGCVSTASETTDKVDLKDESISGIQALAGVTTSFRFFEIGLEYKLASVNTTTFTLGFKL